MARLAASLILAAMLCGGHAVLLQGVAWAGMLASRTAERGWAKAVASTFSGDELCPLCRAAQALGGDDPAPGSPERRELRDAVAKPVALITPLTIRLLDAAAPGQASRPPAPFRSVDRAAPEPPPPQG